MSPSFHLEFSEKVSWKVRFLKLTQIKYASVSLDIRCYHSTSRLRSVGVNPTHSVSEIGSGPSLWYDLKAVWISCNFLLPAIPYSSLTVGIPKELFPNERRVALTPSNTALLKKKGVSKVLVEHNAGVEAQFLNEQYTAAGATLVSREELFASSDVMLKVRPPLLEEEAKHIREGSTVISFLYPSQNKPLVELLAKRRVTRLVAIHSTVHTLSFTDYLSFAMDMIPRISRAQVFDALR